MEEQKKQGGKKPGQKFKSLLVWDILQKRTDENHAISLKEIVEHLKMYGITAERHSINRGSSTMADVVVKIVDLQHEINDDIDRLVDLKREIITVIKSVTNVEYQIILEKRYLCFHTWEQIAVDMHYSGKWVKNLHERALEVVAGILVEKSVPLSSIEFRSA